MKTLKDLNRYDETDTRPIISYEGFDELKQCAIEWYKWHDEKSYRDNLSIMEWIKHFFNLTEEDLK